MMSHWLALWVAVALVGGVALHEGAHAVVAAVVADEWALDWREPALYAEYADDTERAPYLVAVAPIVAAGVAALVVGLVAGAPRLSPGAVPWLGVVVTLVGGGLDEFRGLPGGVSQSP